MSFINFSCYIIGVVTSDRGRNCDSVSCKLQHILVTRVFEGASYVAATITLKNSNLKCYYYYYNNIHLTAFIPGQPG